MAKPRKRLQKQILEVASTKKRDNMASWPSTANEPGLENAQMVTPSSYLWCPTARYRASAPGNYDSARTSDTVFYKGIKEQFTFRTSSGEPFRWRRIIFEMSSPPSAEFISVYKYVAGTNATDKGGIEADPALGYEGVVTYGRPLKVLTTQEQESLEALLYRGVLNVDWWDRWIAKTDSSQVKIRYDKTRIFNPTNGAGVIKQVKQWIPLNETMKYDEGEIGSADTSGMFSNSQRNTMGNIFIFDTFQGNTADTTAAVDHLYLNCESTIYWHER